MRNGSTDEGKARGVKATADEGAAGRKTNTALSSITLVISTVVDCISGCMLVHHGVMIKKSRRYKPRKHLRNDVASE